MNELFAYMLGPKGENAELFRQLINEALDDHVYWRRNFYPEDSAFVDSRVRRSDEFNDFVESLRDSLRTFLSEAKRGIPFFSPRYLGHMHTDLLMPALVGYFSFMLYNQNNVSGESSPISSKLETDVVQMLQRMVGHDPGRGFGYLSSGGTAANIYGAWVARNARLEPLSMLLSLHSLQERSGDDLATRALRAIRTSLDVATAKKERRMLAELTAFEAFNLPIAEVLALTDRASEVLMEALPDLRSLEDQAGRKAARGILESVTSPNSMRQMGLFEFRRRLSAAFPDDTDLTEGNWITVLPRSKHYSWIKAADLLGMGQTGLEFVDLLPTWDTDPHDLERKLEALARSPLGERRWPLMLVSNFGTTEEGALDDLAAVGRVIRRVQEEHGLTVWWHVDACYGGYLATILRRQLADEEPTTADQLKEWLTSTAVATGMKRELAGELVEMSEQGGGWLSWEQLIDRTSAMRDADSIAIDPHKLGYVPYPAGVVLLKDGRGKESVSTDAPYLWALEHDPGGFVGRYTLEGSRGGAVAAGCWLAHRTVPLDQSGHGRIVGMSILGARLLYRSLDKQFGAGNDLTRILFPYQPHSNIVCYSLYHENCRNLSDVNETLEGVLALMRPTNDRNPFDRPFMAVTTELVASPSGLRLTGHDSDRIQAMVTSEEQNVTLKVARSVVMGMFGLVSQLKEISDDHQEKVVPLYEEYALHLDHLLRRVEEKQDIQRALARADSWVRDPIFLVMDDDVSVAKHLKNLLVELRHSKIQNGWREQHTEVEALAEIEDHKNVLDLAFLDIDMRGPTAEPKGSADAGYTALQKILQRNRVVERPRRVQAVVFFSKGYDEAAHEERVTAIVRDFDEEVRPRICGISKSWVEGQGRSTNADRINTVRSIVREIAGLTILRPDS